MNFTISQNKAIKCLSRVVGATDNKDFLDILSFVKIDIVDNVAKFTTTNLDMQSSDSTDVQATGNFSLVAPIHPIMEAIKKLPDSSNVMFSLPEEGGRVVEISSGKFNLNLSVLQVSDFPLMPSVDFENTILIAAPKLLEGIKKTQFSISHDEVRYSLNGLMMHIDEDGRLKCVSTDGHRLSVAACEVTSGNALGNSIIPKRAIGEIVKMLGGITTDVTMKFSSSKFSISIDNFNLTSKLIDGAYPDYKRVIPGSNTNSLVVDAGVLTRAVELVSVANLGQDNKGMMFTIGKDSIEISSKIDSRQATEVIEAEYSGTENMSIKYNYKYILDVLGNISKKKCIFRFSSAESPVLITLADDDSLKYVIMPMKM